MSDLGRLTNRRLARLLEDREATWDATVDAVFDLSADRDPRFQDALSGLGADHPAVVAHNEASSALLEVRIEAQMRLGPDIGLASLVTFLGRSPAYKRNKY